MKNKSKKILSERYFNTDSDLPEPFVWKYIPPH